MVITLCSALLPFILPGPLRIGHRKTATRDPGTIYNSGLGWVLQLVRSTLCQRRETRRRRTARLRRSPTAYSRLARKWFTVSLISFGGLLSPLSANIYFPAIPTLAVAFNESIELINLTVTPNMVLQGLSPMFWGTLSDAYGRRHMFILCLLLLAVSCVGLALTPTTDCWLLLFLRCFQAAGSASTIAIGAGVIGDISTRAERGGFFGVYSIGPMFGPAIGPVLGGVLADKLGWRAIFWFLCIASAICMLVMILFLPETLRTIVGNGSIRPPAIYNPVLPIVRRHPKDPAAERPAVARKTFQNPLLLFLHVDVALLLLINGGHTSPPRSSCSSLSVSW
ncbi:major facilitator superfamily domain-containing protein [Mycena belliarum]|uniref:Major facilitator superfamily domain-containing protein n=1 Tax=Mycena belliarum TaxID=1033014 RepID=A0AAD6XRV6_9AGAR|nr:major facilitator superfamily domain-containing protein [Mycena belliae]